MQTQNQITEPCELLDEHGRLTRPGYAVQPFWRYDRNKIKAGWHRIKEWDYYAILSTENMLFYQGTAHKLDEVTFHMDTGNYLAPWKITSNDRRFEMDFLPLVDRQSQTDFVAIKSVQHQVFGHFSGTVVLDDGQQLELDRVLGFAEDVLNWW